MDFIKLKNALTKNGFKVCEFSSAAAAADYLDKEINGVTVGFGGSVTLDSMGLIPRLSSHNTVYSHWTPPEGMDAREALVRAMLTDVYLCSANAVSESGEIINIDGTGNRIAATVFGHKKVYFVVGKNKICPDYTSAVWRARNVAAPKNAQRLKRKTPCAVSADGCRDCQSPDRICRAMTVLWKPTTGTECEVVLINEDVGY